MVKLTKVQNEIVTAGMNPVLVTAGAGSGKTRVLTHRIEWLLDNGLRDYEILALTFTNKAAREMKERVEKARGSRIKMFLGTFHSWCAMILRRHIGNFSIYDEGDKAKVLKQILGDSKKAKIVEYIMSKQKNGIECYVEEDVQWAIDAYNKKLKENNAFDFDDLLIKTLEILPNLIDKLNYKYILVDEFQDTNRVQYNIVKALAKEHKNIMVVGDEDQCIYTWRGASIENIKLFMKDFSPEVHKLEQNFRSCSNIVKTANLLISHNTDRIEKVLFSELGEGQVAFKKYYDDKSEAREIINMIQAGVTYGGASYSDFCVLMRINALSRGFEEELLRNAIPYVIWGGFKFYERAEVKQALSYLRFMVNPKDNVAEFDAVSFPRRGIGESTFVKIKSGEKTSPKYDEFVMLIERLKSINCLEELGKTFVQLIGLDKAYRTGKEDDERRIDNLYELQTAIVEFAKHHPDATIEQYLQSVTLAGGDGEEQRDRVVLSTIHSAKGLEFKNVFVIGMEDGLFPLERSKHSLEEKQEERRLLYVAITRACEWLQLSYTSSRYYKGERNFQSPSEFLEECGFEPVPSIDFNYGY